MNSDLFGMEPSLDSKCKAAHDDIYNNIVKNEKIKEVNIIDSYSLSVSTLLNFATLDIRMINDIMGIRNKIINYSKDFTKSRPLNILLSATPGSGKSHFVSCLAKSLKEFSITKVNFNMSAVHSSEDYIQPLELVRNFKVIDKLPILFIDEFDSDIKNFARLLQLLWDGMINIGHRELKLGKVIIILAGSDQDILNSYNSIKFKKSDKVNKDVKKLGDLLSRINGGCITFNDLGDYSSDKIKNNKVEKICIAISLLRARFPELNSIPKCLLQFIAHYQFVYGIRSITHLVDAIAIESFIDDKLIAKKMKLPFKDSEEFEKSNLIGHIYIPTKKVDDVITKWLEYYECNSDVIVGSNIIC